MNAKYWLRCFAILSVVLAAVTPAQAQQGAGLAVLAAPTQIALTSAPNPSVYGQAVTFSATVSAEAGTPTGTVDFYDGTDLLGSATLNASGVAQLTISALTTGKHKTMTAQYSGDKNFAGSTSESYAHTVNRAGTTTGIVSLPNPSVYGQMVTITAGVAAHAPGAGTPSGTMNFFDNGTELGSATLDGSGQASFSTSTLAAGYHPTLSAQYSGDANFTGSTSSDHAQIVNQASTTTLLTSAPNPSATDLTVMLSATVFANAPGAGTPGGEMIAFYEGTNEIGTAITDGGGVARLAIPTLPAGVHAFTALFGGDANFSGSVSAIYIHSVRAAVYIPIAKR